MAEYVKWFPYVHVLEMSITLFEDQSTADEWALTSFGETCLAPADLIQNLLDFGEFGEGADHSQHHVILTRHGWTLAEVTKIDPTIG